MKSILLVEDETIVCAEFERTLRRFGFDVQAAHTLEAALRSIRETAFDAVVVEFNLRSEVRVHPRSGNGLQLVRELRTSKTAIPVLIYTAMEGDEYESASLDAGADGFIPKSAGLLCLVSRLPTDLQAD